MPDAPGLSVGDEASAFTAPLVRPDGDDEEVPFGELLDDGPVLLVFYTVEFSPDCVDEWCAFRDFDWFTTSDDVQVVGISKSWPFLHRRFIDHLDLGFPLYADRDLAVAEAFDVRYRAFKLFERARRSCFLVTPDRTVRYRWLAEHWLDPTRSVPPVGDIHEAIVDVLDGERAV